MGSTSRRACVLKHEADSHQIRHVDATMYLMEAHSRIGRRGITALNGTAYSSPLFHVVQVKYFTVGIPRTEISTVIIIIHFASQSELKHTVPYHFLLPHPHRLVDAVPIIFFI